MKQKLLYILLILAVGCSPPQHNPFYNDIAEEPDQLLYSDKELADIEHQYMILRDIFMLVKDSSDLSVQVGHVVIDDEVFYMNCLGSRKEQNIDISKCNYDDLLDSLKASTLLNSIAELKKYKIMGSRFEPSFQDLILIMDVEYNSYGDGRYLYFNNQEVKINEHIYNVLERNGNIYYLGQAK